MKKYTLRALLLSIFFVPLFTVIAADTSYTEGVQSSCPFYDPRSVLVTFTVPKNIASFGSQINFGAEIQNRNSFPVTDATLLIYIIGQDGKVIDTFFTQDRGIVLPPKTTTSHAFSWNAPVFGVSGSYTIRGYIVDSKQFYMGGIPSIEGMHAGQSTFVARGENKSVVSFNEAGSSVNGQPFSKSLGFYVNKDEAVTLATKLEHNFKESTDVIVEWKVYTYSSINEANLIQSKLEKVTLVPGKMATSNVTLTDMVSDEYEVVGEVKWNDAKSLSSTRIYRKGVHASRLSMLVFSPSTEGQSQILACFDSKFANSTDVFPMSIKLSATNENNQSIFQKTFSVDKSSFTGVVGTVVEKGYSKLALVSELSNNNSSLEARNTASYDCNAYTGGICSQKRAFPYVLFVFCIVGLLASFLLYTSHKRSLKNKPLTK